MAEDAVGPSSYRSNELLLLELAKTYGASDSIINEFSLMALDNPRNNYILFELITKSPPSWDVITEAFDQTIKYGSIHYLTFLYEETTKLEHAMSPKWLSYFVHMLMVDIKVNSLNFECYKFLYQKIFEETTRYTNALYMNHYVYKTVATFEELTSKIKPLTMIDIFDRLTEVHKILLRTINANDFPSNWNKNQLTRELAACRFEHLLTNLYKNGDYTAGHVFLTAVYHGKMHSMQFIYKNARYIAAERLQFDTEVTTNFQQQEFFDKINNLINHLLILSWRTHKISSEVKRFMYCLEFLGSNDIIPMSYVSKIRDDYISYIYNDHKYDKHKYDVGYALMYLRNTGKVDKYRLHVYHKISRIQRAWRRYSTIKVKGKRPMM